MKKCIHLVILLFLTDIIISCGGGGSYSGAAQDSAANKQTSNFDNKPKYALQGDTSFAVDAAGNELAEMAFANLALKQSNDSTVKDFARFMIDDHSRVYKELQEIVLEKKMVLPAVLDAKHQKIFDDLKNKTGAEFDLTYIGSVLDLHKEALLLMEIGKKDVHDVELQSFAEETYPTIRDHLAKALELQKSIK